MSNKDLEKMNLAQLKAEHNEISAGNDNDRKIAVLTKIIKLDPEDSETFNNRGGAYIGLGKHDKAIEDFNQAIKLNPEYVETFYNRGTTYNYLDEHDKAIEDFNQAIKLNLEHAKAFYNRGIAYRKLGKEDLAIKDFKEAVELNPTIITQEQIKKNDNDHQVFNEDSNQLIKKIEGDILYLDPPYNQRQYGSNYHLLNTIAKSDEFVPKGKTGLREYNRSQYCKKSTVAESFETLIKNAQFKHIFLSYNNEGLMNGKTIKSIMQKYGRYDLTTTQYQRFKADKNRFNKADKTTEYLHILEKNE